MARRKLTDDDFEEILYGGVFEGHTYEEKETKQIGSSRWMAFHQTILARDDGTLWGVQFSRGLTEMQDNGVEDPELFPVIPKEVVRIVYEEVTD